MPPPARRKLTPVEEADIVQAYTSHTMAPADIKAVYAISNGLLYRVLKRAGASPAHRPVSHRPVAPPLMPGTRLVPAPATDLKVTLTPTDQVDHVERVHPTGRGSTWIIQFTGLLQIQAESIDLALSEARKLPAVRRIYSIRLKSRDT